MICIWHNWPIWVISKYSWFPNTHGRSRAWPAASVHLRTLKKQLSRGAGSVSSQSHCDGCFLGVGVGAQRREWLPGSSPLGGWKKASQRSNAGPGLPKRRGGWGGCTQQRKKVPLRFNYVYWRPIVSKTSCWTHWSHLLLTSTQRCWCCILLPRVWTLIVCVPFPSSCKPSLTSKLIIFLSAFSGDHVLESALGSRSSVCMELGVGPPQ